MSRIERVKQHFRNNKVTYIAVGVSVVVTAGVTYYFVGKPNIQAGVKIRQFMPWKPVNTVTNVVELTAPTPRGQYGHLIHCVSTNEWFASQKRAAELLGIDRGLLRKHLKGLIPDVNGLKFEDLGEYMPAAMAA